MFFQILGRTIRVDHVKDYKAPKEHGDEDEVTRKIRAEGCAPTLVLEIESDEEEEEAEEAKKKSKKGLKLFISIHEIGLSSDFFICHQAIAKLKRIYIIRTQIAKYSRESNYSYSHAQEFP